MFSTRFIYGEESVRKSHMFLEETGNCDSKKGMIPKKVCDSMQIKSLIYMLIYNIYSIRRRSVQTEQSSIFVFEVIQTRCGHLSDSVAIMLTDSCRKS